MTVEQMHEDVNLGLQTIDSFTFESFESSEIDRYLNMAQDEFVSDRFRGLNEPGFEENMTRVGDLREIVTTAILIPAIDGATIMLGSQYESLIPYPIDWMYYVNLEVGLTRSANPTIASKEYHPCKPILDESYLIHYRVNTRHRPYIRVPGVFFREGFMHVFGDAETTLVDSRITYVRYPVRIYRNTSNSALSISCELPDHTHNSVVNIAIRLMMGDLKNDSTPRDQLETEAI